MAKVTFQVEITASNVGDLREAYHDLIENAVNISNSNATAIVTVMAPDVPAKGRIIKV